jgi:hypothetical protein
MGAAQRRWDKYNHVIIRVAAGTGAAATIYVIVMEVVKR